MNVGALTICSLGLAALTSSTAVRPSVQFQSRAAQMSGERTKQASRQSWHIARLMSSADEEDVEQCHLQPALCII
jgi:hypothetical protein